MSAVVVAGDTSGTVTLQAPAIAGSTTINLPATTGTMALNVSGENATSFLGADVNMSSANTPYDGPNTGSIGASGQMWLIMATIAAWDTVGSAIIQTGIWNGSSYITAESLYSTGTQGVVITMHCVVTLSGATTFTLRGQSNTTTSVIKTTGNASLASNKSTNITAVRLA